jgi:hypothetical protein
VGGLTPLVQRRSRETGPAQELPPLVTDVVSSPGEPLAPEARTLFEARFDRDLSTIRVHRDGPAGKSARAVNARAYTVGHHLVFAAGEYRPGTEQGRLLLAHELTHTVQQAAAGRGPGGVLQRSEGGGSPGGLSGGGKTILIYAGGYDQYGDEANEIEVLRKKQLWFPGTKDFHATASESGVSGYRPATKANEFFGPLQAAEGSIGRIVFIGHGGGEYLGLSGRFGGTDERVHTAAVEEFSATIDLQIKPKLAATATIDLFSCDSAYGGVIMTALANAFGVRVRGFNTGIRYCIGFSDPENDPSSARITSRGRWVPGGVSANELDCGAPEWIRGVGSTAPPVAIDPGLSSP